LLVRGGLVSLPAGEVETDDEDLIKALRGAKDADEVKAKQVKQSKTEAAE